MRGQRRIFSVATTIACLALASPAFAQTYIGGSNAPSVEVDLGALNALPGNSQRPAPTRHRARTNVNYQGTSSLQTTIIGGGSDAIAPVTVLHKGKHFKTAPADQKPVMTTDELNAMQLSSQKAMLPNAPAPQSTASVAMPGAAKDALPLDKVPSPAPLPGSDTTPAILPNRAQQSDRKGAPPVTTPQTPLPPARDEYDRQRPPQTALAGAPPTPITLPKLPPNTPVTTDTLNHAELTQILAEKGETLAPLPAPETPVAAAPKKKRAPTKTQVKAPTQTVEAAPPAIVEQTPPPKARKTASAKTSTVAPDRSITADDLNRAALIKPSATAAPPVAQVAEAAPAPTPAPAPAPPAVAPPPVAPAVKVARVVPPLPAPAPPPALPPAPRAIVMKAAPPPPAPTSAATITNDEIDEVNPPPTPIPTPIPPPTPAPVSAPAPTKAARIITDPNQPRAATPQHFNTVGNYDIPSVVALNNTAPLSVPPVVQQQAPMPIVKSQVAPPVALPPPQPAAPRPPAPQIAAAMPLDQGIVMAPVVATLPPAPAPAPAPVKTAEIIPAVKTVALPPAPEPVIEPVVKSEPLPLDQAPAPVVEKTASVLPPPPPMSATPQQASYTPPPAQTSRDNLSVSFSPGATSLSQEATANLNGLVGRLKQNADLRVELRSMASAEKGSTSKARRTSLTRALAVKSYLTGQGIADDRIDARALGAPPGQPPSDRVDFFLMR